MSPSWPNGQGGRLLPGTMRVRLLPRAQPGSVEAMDIILFATLIWQVIDFARELANFGSERSSVVTQLSAWLVGIAAVALGAHADVTAGITFPGTGLPLGQLDFGSVVLVGLMAASLASSLVDTKQALDRGDTARKPALLGPKRTA